MKNLGLAVLFIMLLNVISFSQETDTQNILLIKHKEKNRVKYMKEGKRIVYWLDNNDVKNKGKLTEIKDSVLIIDDQEFSLDEITRIGGRSVGLKATKIAGGIVTASGTVVSGFGLIFIVEGYRQDDCGGAILVVMGYMMAIVGVPAVVIGSIPFLITNRKFDTEKWELQIAEEIPKRKKDVN